MSTFMVTTLSAPVTNGSGSIAALLVFVFVLFAVVAMVVMAVKIAKNEQRKNDEFLYEAYDLAHRTEMSKFMESTQESMHIMNSKKE